MRRVGVDHVPQHLGGHHHHRRLGVDAGVAGQQADVGRAVPADQVGVLLVRQRLDRGGVERLAAPLQGQPDRELADDRLAGPGRRGDQHARSRPPGGRRPRAGSRRRRSRSRRRTPAAPAWPGRSGTVVRRRGADRLQLLIERSAGGIWTFDHAATLPTPTTGDRTIAGAVGPPCGVGGSRGGAGGVDAEQPGADLDVETGRRAAARRRRSRPGRPARPGRSAPGAAPRRGRGRNGRRTRLGQQPQQLGPAGRVDDGHVEQPSPGSASRADLHAAAVVGAVPDREQHRVQLTRPRRRSPAGTAAGRTRRISASAAIAYRSDPLGRRHRVGAGVDQRVEAGGHAPPPTKRVVDLQDVDRARAAPDDDGHGAAATRVAATSISPRPRHRSLPVPAGISPRSATPGIERRPR